MPTATASQLAETIKELDDVRRQGWALDDGYFQDGVCCVAAAFFRSGSSVAGSVSVSAPAARFPAARDHITGAVRDSALRVSEILGYDADPLETALNSHSS
jgi:DNA-binding IclR family transcriptional regulator